jgi:CRP-like cAMP-binding protein
MPHADRESIAALFVELTERADFLEGKHWERRRCKNQEVLVEAGRRSGKVFVLVSGRMRVLGDVEVGEECRVRPGVKDLEPGDVIGEIALFDRGTHAATVTSLTDSEVIAIDGGALTAFCMANPEEGCRLFFALAVQLAKRLRRADEQIFKLLGWGLKVHGYEELLKKDDCG